MSEATIRVAYDGDALRSGTMDVRDLAPALIALSDLFEEASKVLNGKETNVQLRVKSEFRAGSFDVTLEVIQTWASKFVALFNDQKLTAVLNLAAALGLVTGGGAGLIKLVKWIRGRKVERVETLTETTVRILVEDDAIIVETKVAKLLNDVPVRQALSRVLEPLQREGVDTFQARSPQGEPIETVKAHEVHAFVAPPPAPGVPENIHTSEYTALLTLVAVTFKEGNKWRVSDGQNTFSVTIADESFLKQVSDREVGFVKDDRLLCRVKQVQVESSQELRAEHTVLEVLEHRHASRQSVFDWPDAKDT